MMKEFDEIDRLFQENLGAFEAQPDALVKTNIDKAINASKRKKRILFWFLPSLLAFGSMSFYTFSYFKTNVTNQNKNNLVVEQSSEKEIRSSVPRNKFVTKIKKSDNNSNCKVFSTKGLPGLDSENMVLRPVIVHHQSKRLNAIFNGNKSLIQRNLAMEENQFIAKVHVENDSLDLTENQSNKKVGIVVGKDLLDTAIIQDADNQAENVTIVDPKSTVDKWVLSFYSGFDMMQKREKIPNFESFDFLNSKSNFNQFRSQFYTARIEVAYRLNPKWDLSFGLGYQWNTIRKTETRYYIDSVHFDAGITTLNDTVIYFKAQNSEIQKFNIQSLILPLGLAYTSKVTEKLDFRLALGMEMAFGKLREDPSSFELTKPSFQSFGIRTLLRPELNYIFGKVKLGIYGTINQPIRNQMIWTNFRQGFPHFGGGFTIRFPMN